MWTLAECPVWAMDVNGQSVGASPETATASRALETQAKPYSTSLPRTLGSEQEYISAVLGQELIRYAAIEVPSRENIHVKSEGTERYLDVVIKWSPGDEGRVAVFFDGSKAPVMMGTGPNMHNGFQHYLKLGMYRHPEIATENRLDIRHVRIEKLKDWPER